MFPALRACIAAGILVFLPPCVHDALGGPPPLMLATVWTGGDDPTGWWMSEKYDGIRGYWDGRAMWSRNGEPIPVPEAFRAVLPPFALDGELWAGRGGFEAVASTVRDRVAGPGWARIRYVVFDLPGEEAPFEARLGHFADWLEQHPAAPLMAAGQVRCEGAGHLQAFLTRIEREGGEGVMLRAPASPYQAGRSPFLRKYKSFQDAEARVIGYNPGRGKYAGLVGSLLVELADGTRFSVGSGLTELQRRNPPAIGSEITFKHHGWTGKGKPRFPVFWRVRQPDTK